MKRRSWICLLIVLCCCQRVAAQDDGFQTATANDSLQTDSIDHRIRVFDLLDSAFNHYERIAELPRRKRKQLIRGYLGAQWEEMNNIDTTYIIPQLYDYAVMLQNTNTFETFSISSSGDKKQTLRFAPKPTFRLGGYFGWRWLFLGYTFDVGSLLGKESTKKQKTDITLSFYTSRLGIDLYYRKAGNDFRCTTLNSLFDADHPRPEGLSNDFDGLNIQTRGINLYYIFNHRHFSWPAAFAQSTVQRRSCGTFKLGFSFTHHKVSLDDSRFDARIVPLIDSSLYFDVIKYNDYSINFGYAYNWVFHKNWLACASFSPALAYNVMYIDRGEDPTKKQSELDRLLNFSDNRFNFDFILRLGAVYNNTRYFAGASFVLHSFNYSHKHIHLNNAFGSLNFYVGFNFKRKKEFTY